MVYYKHTRKKNSRFGKSKKMPCFKCGKNIELGDVFYSKITKRTDVEFSLNNYVNWLFLTADVQPNQNNTNHYE